MRDFNRYEKRLFKFLQSYSSLNQSLILLFGSRARGDYRSWSDIDIALKNLPNDFKIHQLEEEIDELNIPYEVELVNIDQVSKDFYDKCMDEAVDIKDIKLAND